MFIEPYKDSGSKRGWVEVICGSMFSGKTEELIRRLKRAKIANQKTEIFKPEIDKRYDDVKIVSHDANEIGSIPVSASMNILLIHSDAQVIGIDEAQFFDDELPWVCEQLANSGARVIVAGLDKDFAGKPFGPMPAVMAIAEYVTKVHAICVICGNPATHSFRKEYKKDIIMLGEKEIYEPRCRFCFNNGMAEQLKNRD